MHKSNKVLFFVTVSMISIAILLSNFYLLLYDKPFYAKEFAKVGSKIGNKEIFLTDLFNFFKGKGNLDSYFNEREIEHLYDVKAVISGFVIALQAALFLSALSLLLIIRKRERWAEALIRLLIFSGALSILISTLFFIISLNFDWLFAHFHQIFFKPGTWLFGDTDLLIKIFPQQFFMDFFGKILLNNFISGGIMVVVGIALTQLKKAKRW